MRRGGAGRGGIRTRGYLGAMVAHHRPDLVKGARAPAPAPAPAPARSERFERVPSNRVTPMGRAAAQVGGAWAGLLLPACPPSKCAIWGVGGPAAACLAVGRGSSV